MLSASASAAKREDARGSIDAVAEDINRAGGDMELSEILLAKDTSPGDFERNLFSSAPLLPTRCLSEWRCCLISSGSTLAGLRSWLPSGDD